MKFAVIALMTLSFLSGCAREPSRKLILPDVVEYSKATQIKAADELQACHSPTIMEFMKDYSVMRDQTRAARKVLK